ncbi:hypothetical protein BaRGS_00013468 [Batillaria attramentaria]|uniref:Uncharacterized protein n=1 Tax=Batillaria attramentaria TaxID=370345 RepID=A0ABD0L7N0_9CAEN
MAQASPANFKLGTRFSHGHQNGGAFSGVFKITLLVSLIVMACSSTAPCDVMRNGTGGEKDVHKTDLLVKPHPRFSKQIQPVREKRMAGGVVPRYVVPFMVKLMVDGEFKCTGTILNKDEVVTLCSCFPVNCTVTGNPEKLNSEIENWLQKADVNVEHHTKSGNALRVKRIKLQTVGGSSPAVLRLAESLSLHTGQIESIKLPQTRAKNLCAMKMKDMAGWQLEENGSKYVPAILSEHKSFPPTWRIHERDFGGPVFFSGGRNCCTLCDIISATYQKNPFRADSDTVDLIKQASDSL